MADSQKLFEGGYEFVNDFELFLTSGNVELFKKTSMDFGNVLKEYLESNQYKEYCNNDRNYALLIERIQTNMNLLEDIEFSSESNDFIRICTDINQSLLKLSEFNAQFYAQSIKNRFYLILVSFFLVIFFVILLSVIRHNLLKTKNELSKNKEFTDTVLNAIENERSHISNELHDTVAQEIRTIRFEVEQLKCQESFSSKRERVSDLCTKCIQELRNICYNLLPPDLKLEKSSVQLENLMEFLCNNFNNELKGRILCNFRADEDLYPIKNQKVLLNIFRIVQEALNNIKNHSQASCCSVVLVNEKDFEGIVIYITDDGVGIRPEILAEGRKMHFGLHSMKSRAQSIGGDFKIYSEINDGTEIILKIPASADKISMLQGKK